MCEPTQIEDSQQSMTISKPSNVVNKAPYNLHPHKHTQENQTITCRIIKNRRKNGILDSIYIYSLLLFSASPASSGSSEFLIPQPAVFKDKVTGRRPKLMVKDRLRARG